MKFISALTGGPAVIVHLSHTVSKISLLASFRIFYKFLTDRNFMSLYTNRSIINYEHFFKIFFSRLVLHTCTNEPRKSVRNVKACDQQHAIPEFNFRVLIVSYCKPILMLIYNSHLPRAEILGNVMYPDPFEC